VDAPATGDCGIQTLERGSRGVGGQALGRHEAARSSHRRWTQAVCVKPLRDRARGAETGAVQASSADASRHTSP
jgi:hypothetical protein